MGSTVKTLPLVLIATAALGCSSGGSTAGADSSSGSDSASVSGASAATPVQMGRVTETTLGIIVSGPGRTEVVAQQRVRAPFTGSLVSITVAPGDHVRTGQQIGTMVSQNSQAALTGARAMLGSAQTSTERQDAQRAVQLATQSVVRAPVRANVSGTVVSRSASPGDLLNQGDDIVIIAASGSIVFVADMAQSDVAQIRVGQPASIDLTGGLRSLSGTVHVILPADTMGGLVVPVRIDLAATGSAITLGLFGTANIQVGQRSNAVTVPVAAVLRDDISGITQVATVGSDNRAHWVTVTTGATQGGRTEIVSPAIPVGTRVITMGQVGLPDSTRVTLEKTSDSTPQGQAPASVPAR